MTLRLQKPHPETIRAILDAQAKFDFTYLAVGATASQLPRQLQKHFGKDSLAAAFRAGSR